MHFGHWLYWPLGILLAGSALTASDVTHTMRSNAHQVNEHAQQAVDLALLQVDTLLRRYQYGLFAVRGVLAVAGTDRIDRATFLRYSQTRNYAVEFPGARGFGFIRRVAPEGVDAYIARQRGTGAPAFALRQFRDHAGERAIIELIEPIDASLAALGLDIASEPVRRAGAAAASAAGAATLTAPIALVTDGGPPRLQSFLLLLPVYGADGPAQPRTVVGWAYAPLNFDDVRRNMPETLPDGTFTLTDNTPGAAPVRFYAAGTGAPAYGSVRQSRRVLGREWVATFQPSQAFVDALRLPKPLHVGLVGGVLTLLCAALGGMLAAQRARQRRLHAYQEKLVMDRTREVEAARRDLRTILDAVPSMIGYWDVGQCNRFANRAYQEWFGRTPAALAGATLQELLGETLYARNLDYINAVMRGEPQTFERTAMGRDGVTRHYLVRYLPDIADGVVNGFYTLVDDVSEIVASRQALALALRENDVLVRTINEQILYSVTDDHGIILEVNDNFCIAFGYQRDELLGAHYWLLSSGQHDRAFWADMRQTVMAGRTWQGTVCSRAANGTEKWFDTVVAPYFGAHGVIERYVALHTDVTARLAADAALRRVSALLGNVLRAASEMSVIATDAEGVITVFNTGAERMLGYAAADTIGQVTPTIFHDAAEVAARAQELSRQLGEPVEQMRAIIELARRESVETREWTYVRKDGSRFPVLLTVTAMRDDAGTVLGYLGIGIDISQRKRDDATLRESMQRAEQASVAKSQFVANMSHEIRTPMNAMLGMLELTLRTDLSARQRDYVDKARGAGATLLALLNDVLDFSKIDAGKLALDNHVFEVDLLLRDLAVVLTGNSINKQVEVMFDVAPAVPARLQGDRQRIGQVLVNLAGNALKFTQAGSVVVGIHVLAENPGAITLRLSVTDTGIGIPAGQLGMIFDGFTQAESSTARRFGGTGLGLAISAGIVALMGGALKVSSEVGRGSRFWCDITLDTVPEEGGAEVAAPCGRALVVDDNAQSGTFLAQLVARAGFGAACASGADTAIPLLAAAAAAGAPFDVVLMDVRTPQKHGPEAAAMYAADPGSAAPVIIVTAYAEEALRAALHGIDAPFFAMLNKPVTPIELACVLARATGTAPAALVPEPVLRQQRLAGLRLLVVEDNFLNRQVALELLGSEGAIVDLAEGGQQGVDMATGPTGRYDAVIMDVQMPDIDGLEATRRIRAAPGFAHLPIMAMTANVSAADRDACLAAGMDSHVGKPFDIDEVAARVRGLVAPGTAPGQDAPPPAVHNDAVLIDLAEALPRFLDDAGLYARLLGNFEHESGALLARLEDEQAIGDARAEAATRHALKGMALAMGARRLAQALAVDAAPGESARNHTALAALTATSVQAARSALAALAH